MARVIRHHKILYGYVYVPTHGGYGPIASMPSYDRGAQVGKNHLLRWHEMVALKCFKHHLVDGWWGCSPHWGAFLYDDIIWNNMIYIYIYDVTSYMSLLLMSPLLLKSLWSIYWRHLKNQWTPELTIATNAARGRRLLICGCFFSRFVWMSPKRVLFYGGKRMMNHQIWMIVVPKNLIIGTKPYQTHVSLSPPSFFAAVLLALLVLLCSTAQAEVCRMVIYRSEISHRTTQTVDAV